MSSFDAMLTTVPEDVREAIEEVCNEAGTFDADWCILKAAGELIAKSRTLPRVSPEGLVEGKWYVVKDSSGEKHVVYCVIDPDEGPGLYALDVCFEEGWSLKNVPIWGPIPEFELEGEA